MNTEVLWKFAVEGPDFKEARRQIAKEIALRIEAEPAELSDWMRQNLGRALIYLEANLHSTENFWLRAAVTHVECLDYPEGEISPTFKLEDQLQGVTREQMLEQAQALRYS
jgi:hypothetical protein